MTTSDKDEWQGWVYSWQGISRFKRHTTNILYSNHIVRCHSNKKRDFDITTMDDPSHYQGWVRRHQIRSQGQTSSRPRPRPPNCVLEVSSRMRTVLEDPIHAHYIYWKNIIPTFRACRQFTFPFRLKACDVKRFAGVVAPNNGRISMTTYPRCVVIDDDIRTSDNYNYT
jgi:hypothetical protein